MTEKALPVASYTASSASFIGGMLSLNDIAIIIGIGTALATFGLTVWATLRRDRRERQAHAEQMRIYRAPFDACAATEGEHD